MNDKPNTETSWHSIDLPSLLKSLEATENGLSESEAVARIAKYGANTLPHKPPPAFWEIFIHQFKSPLIYILVIAAVISILIKEPTDAGFIIFVLLLNAVIGGYQEWKAEQSAQALQRLLQVKATVLRDGEVKEINAEIVVPGDVVWLESGNRVPTDIRLFMTTGLEIDESLLTGESLPVLKDKSWSGEPSTPIADRLNMAYAGSIVTRGRAKGVVVATGLRTVVGELALDVMAGTGGEPPLVTRMKRFTHVIGITVLSSAAAIGVLGLVLGRYGLTEMLLFVVALAVSAIPEGLPIAMTVALAIATTKMARRGVIVRKLTAVEGLGSCTYIATDKTGTLTRNELTVKEVRLSGGGVFHVSGVGFAPEGEVLSDDRPIDRGSHPELERLAIAAVLCNEADLHHRDGGWVWRGDTVDISLLSFGHKLGYDRESLLGSYPQVNEIPFEPERQFSATFHSTDQGSTTVFVKGAPERVLEMCGAGEGADKAGCLAAAEDMARRGFRVIALADGNINAELDPSMVPPEPGGLRLLGFTGMIDPLRHGVPEAVKTCRDAGVEVSMVTGDHPVTALAIARDLGMASDPSQVVTGTELAEMSPEDLQKIIAHTNVFARVSPNQKYQIVESARSIGHFVAVTGDGVNDAPALRSANIGIAMGKEGTDVAREASELVISDDNFATIVAGIEEGRIAYNNIRKVIFLLISTGAAELVLITLSLAAGLPLPLLPVQILWLNLVTNGIQDKALAFEPGEGDSLQKKPRRPDERIFNRIMIERTLVAALTMGVVGFGFFYYLIHNGWSESAARNVLFLLMVLFENVHIGNCRSETKSALVLSPLRSPILLIGALTALLVHVGAMYLPLGQRILGTEPVSLETWGMVAALALTVFVTSEIQKLVWHLRKKPA
jgi:Ca2+-transporting ATPase